VRKEGVSTDPAAAALARSEGGTRLRLLVRAGARNTEIAGIEGGALRIRVTAPPEKGRANRAVLELLGRTLGVPASHLRILAGQASPKKTVFVPLEPRVVAERLGLPRPARAKGMGSVAESDPSAGVS